MDFKILIRHRTDEGILLGYTLQNCVTGEKLYYTSQQLQLGVASGFVNIVNAYARTNGEYRAKSGKIATQIDYTNIKAPATRNLPVKMPNFSNTVMPDCYGKDYINACKRIRSLASKRKVHIDRALQKHKSNGGNNVHLIALIEDCGITAEEFIIGYLSVIQPYSLKKFQGQKPLSKADIWLSDIGYNVDMVIKLQMIRSEECMVVSFHESIILRNGVLSQSRTRETFSGKPCAVIIDELGDVKTWQSGQKTAEVGYTIQRGFMRHKVHSITDYLVNEVALVQHEDIDRAYNGLINKLMNRLRVIYLDKQAVEELGLSLNKISFLAHGHTAVNNFQLMIDCYSEYKDPKSRSFFIEITSNILNEVPTEELKRIQSSLGIKYGLNYNNKLYQMIQQYDK